MLDYNAPVKVNVDAVFPGGVYPHKRKDYVLVVYADKRFREIWLPKQEVKKFSMQKKYIVITRQLAERNHMQWQEMND